MNVLFVHNNFPAQFRHISKTLLQAGGFRLAAIGEQGCGYVEGVDIRRYAKMEGATPETHSFARRFDHECRRAERVMFQAMKLKNEGFEPDLILGHCGWGETLPLRALFSRARIAVYCEFFYRAEGQDVGFDDEMGRFGLDGHVLIGAKNASTLISLVDADIGISPTPWQKATFPQEFQSKIHVAHEGVDTTWIAPDASAKFQIPGGPRLDRDDEVITYFTRGYEPTRGFHVFMRALPDLMRRRPNAHVVLVGNEDVYYGVRAPDGLGWKEYCLLETMGGLDISRVHFLNWLPHADLRSLMQISTVHVYLTYPFVLSWSCVEAMSAGCAVVGSDTGPVRDVIVDDENGVLTPFHDVAALSAKIADLAADAPRRARLGKRARETARARFDVADCVKRSLNLLGLQLAPREAEGHVAAVVAA
jgi:glycosyltransferase involved in cell wall biosynthesis